MCYYAIVIIVIVVVVVYVTHYRRRQPPAHQLPSIAVVVIVVVVVVTAAAAAGSMIGNHHYYTRLCTFLCTHLYTCCIRTHVHASTYLHYRRRLVQFVDIAQPPSPHPCGCGGLPVSYRPNALQPPWCRVYTVFWPMHLWLP